MESQVAVTSKVEFDVESLDLDHLNEVLEYKTAQERLEWAIGELKPNIILSSSFGAQAAVCLHYWINRLQPLPWQTPVLVSLNPARPIAPERIVGEWDYEHPVFSLAAIEAQRQLSQIQGRSHVWFCGAWTRYGFHEDGLASALEVAAALRGRWAAEPARAA